jgi:hypothetical protein
VILKVDRAAGTSHSGRSKQLAQTPKKPALLPKFICAETVSKPLEFGVLGLRLSERQIPQVVGFLRSGRNQREPVEWAAVLVRQAL